MLVAGSDQFVSGIDDNVVRRSHGDPVIDPDTLPVLPGLPLV